MIATRLLHFAASALLLGTYVFWCLIAWPAFDQGKAAQTLRARLDRQLLAIVWISVLVAFVTGGVWLVILASQMSGMPLSAVLQGNVIVTVLTQTRFGEAWTLRVAILVALAICLIVQRTTRKHVWAWIGLLAASAFLAGLAWAGHGAAAEDVPFDALHLPADILHLLATGTWLGGLLPLVLLLVAARRDDTPEDVTVARAATLRFSVLGVWSVGTLLATGVVNTWFLSGSVPALLGTLYGQLLVVKIALFAAMIAVASINRRRLVPRLCGIAAEAVSAPVIRQLGRNASIEASLGVFVLAIVAIIGILTPGAHTEPRWPLPFRLDFSEFPQVIVPAYPTSFYVSTQPYAAPSVAHGAPLYAENCAVCHGAEGRGDGPLAGKLPIRPADLTEPHLFAHKVGEIYWWVSYGRSNGVMPGFAGKLSPEQRWDLINFVLARAAGILTNGVGPQITTTNAVPVPDFAFERNGAQNTLSQTVKTGPVLLVLFATRAPHARLQQLARSEKPLAAAGLRVLTVGLGASPEKGPLVVEVSQDVRVTLSLFRSPKDGGETELMLDRGANVRARWTANGPAGLPDATTLIADTVRVASLPVAAANHAGHAH